MLFRSSEFKLIISLSLSQQGISISMASKGHWPGSLLATLRKIKEELVLQLKTKIKMKLMHWLSCLYLMAILKMEGHIKLTQLLPRSLFSQLWHLLLLLELFCGSSEGKFCSHKTISMNNAQMDLQFLRIAIWQEFLMTRYFKKSSKWKQLKK